MRLSFPIDKCALDFQDGTHIFVKELDGLDKLIITSRLNVLHLVIVSELDLLV